MLDYLLLSKAKGKETGEWHVGYIRKTYDFAVAGAPARYFITPLNKSVSEEVDELTICACTGVVAQNDETGADYIFTNDIISVSLGEEQYSGFATFVKGCHGIEIPKSGGGGFDFVPFHMFNPNCNVKVVGNSCNVPVEESAEEPADPKKPTIVCISGKARHGKDSFGEYLRRALIGKEKKVLVVHYGDLLKYIAQNFWGWDGKKNEAGRTLLQEVGTDIVRAQYPDYWVKFIAEQLEFSYGQWQYILIPDCRFENECGRLFDKERFDIKTVRVVRPNFDNGLTEEQKSHPSETSLDDFVFNYQFECTLLEELKEKANLLAEIITL